MAVVLARGESRAEGGTIARRDLIERYLAQLQAELRLSPRAVTTGAGIALVGYAIDSSKTSTTQGALLAAGTAAVFFAALAAAVMAGASAAQALRAGLDAPGEPDIWGDIVEAGRRLGHAGPVRQTLDWVEPRRHPWRLCVVVALGAGLAAATAHFVGEGPPSAHRILMGLLAGLIIVAIEAAAVAACFAAFGGWLGLRAGRRPGTPVSG